MIYIRVILSTMLIVLSIPMANAQNQKSAIEEVPVPARSELLKIMEGDHVLGDETAPVTIIEYASMSCSHCRSFHKNVFPELNERYIKTGKVKFVLRDFPLDETALRASQIIHCSDDERYYTFVDAIFTAQNNWAGRKNYLEILTNIARLGGLTSEQIDVCLADTTLEEKIIASKYFAVKGLEVRSTPTLFINGTKFNGGRDIEFLSQTIDKLLTAAQE